MKRELHETTGSYHNRVQGCQTSDIRMEKKSSRSHSIVMTRRVFFPEVFPARMILLFTIKNILSVGCKSHICKRLLISFIINVSGQTLDMTQTIT